MAGSYVHCSSRAFNAFLLGILVSPILDGNIAGQDRVSSSNRNTDSKAPDFRIAKSAPIEMLFDSYHNVIDLGPLPTRQSGIVTLKLSNPHSTTFDFEGIEIGCKCTSAEMTKTNVESGDATIITIGLDTPKAARTQNRSNSIRLIEKGGDKRSVNLVLRYTLSGLMNFKVNSYVIEVQDDSGWQEVRLPFLITPPVKEKNIELEIQPDSSGLSAEFVSDENTHFVVAKFHSDDVPENGLALTVTARHRLEGLADTARLLLTPRKQLEVTPRTLRFKIMNGAFEASALLRYRPAAKDALDELADDRSNALSVEARIGDLKGKVRAKRLGRGIHRLHLSLPEAEFRKDLDGQKPANAISWHVVTPEGSFSQDSRFTVDIPVSVSSTTE